MGECRKKSWASSDHRPPVSQARPNSPVNSGYLRSLVRRAWSRAAPFRVAHCLRGAPSALTGLTKVVSIANCAPWKRGKPSATTSRRRSSNWPPGKRSRSWTLMLVDTLAPASLQMRAAQLSKGNPRRPSTPEVAHAARWWPRESSGWPHRQKADERGSGHQRRRRRRMRKHCGSKRDAGDVGEQWNGIPAMGPCCERASACSVGPNLGHTTLWKKVPSMVEEAKDCHPMREILGNSSSGWNPGRCPRATSPHSGASTPAATRRSLHSLAVSKWNPPTPLESDTNMWSATSG